MRRLRFDELLRRVPLHVCALLLLRDVVAGAEPDKGNHEYRHSRRNSKDHAPPRHCEAPSPRGSIDDWRGPKLGIRRQQEYREFSHPSYRARVRLLVLVAVALGIALLGTGKVDRAESAAQGLTWNADASPFRLTVLDAGNVLIRQKVGRPGAGTRFSFRRQDDGTFGTLTDLLKTSPIPNGSVYTVATTEPSRTATVTVLRSGRGLGVTLDLGPGSGPIRTVYEAFESGANEHFLGTGEQRDHVDLNGTIVPLKVWDTCGRGKTTPFYLSSRGYGVRFRTTAVGRIGFGRVEDANGCQLGTSPCEIASGTRVVQTCFKTSKLSYEIYPGSPQRSSAHT